MIQPQYAQPYAQGTPSASAVNIQIFEPKAYASPQPAAMQPNYTNQLYNYPQASLYGAEQAPYAPYPMAPMPQQYPGMQMPQYPGMPMQQPLGYPGGQILPYPGMQMPQQPLPGYPGGQILPYPSAQMPQQPVYEAPPQVVSPQPQPMPETVMQQPTVQPQAPAAPTPEIQVQQPVQPAQTVDVAGLVTALQSTDPAAQEAAITQIANYSQSEPAVAQQVLNQQIMGSLADIVNADNSQLQDSTPEQLAAIAKANNGEQLTPEEQQLASTISPKAAADKNKIISMFTLAMLQKNQRDELDAYMAAQGETNNLIPLSTDNLIGFKEIQNQIQTNENPEVRLAGIQALSYVAKPEDAAVIQSSLQNSLNDPEPIIQQAAQEVLNKFGVAAQPQQEGVQDNGTQEGGDIIQMPQQETAEVEQAPTNEQGGDIIQMPQQETAEAQQQAPDEQQKGEVVQFPQQTAA